MILKKNYEKMDVSGENNKENRDYSKKAEDLRMEIAKRTSQLQTIAKAVIKIMKDRGDFVLKRVVERDRKSVV